MGLFRHKDKQQPAHNSQGEKSVGDIVNDAVTTALSKYAKKDKRKNKKGSDDKLYITPEDISQLRDKYQPLFQQLREDEECSNPDANTNPYLNVMCDTIISAMQTEIGDISLSNKLDHELMLTQIEARNKKQIPAYTHPLRRLFLKTPNRAMAIILDEAELSADEIHSMSEHENDVSAFRIEKVKAELIATADVAKNAKGKKISRRRLKKLRRKYDELSELFAPLQPEEGVQRAPEPEQAPPENVPEEAPAEQLPVRKKRKKKTSDENGQLPGQIEIEKVVNNDDSNTNTGI